MRLTVHACTYRLKPTVCNTIPKRWHLFNLSMHDPIPKRMHIYIRMTVHACTVMPIHKYIKLGIHNPISKRRHSLNLSIHNPISKRRPFIPMRDSTCLHLSNLRHTLHNPISNRFAGIVTVCSST